MNSDRLTSIVVVGARGRMGKSLIREVLESESLTLVGAVARTGAPGLGTDAGTLVGMPHIGVPLSDELAPPRGSVVVDFSLPEATQDNLARCRDVGVPLVLGTTGLPDSIRADLTATSANIPLVVAPNFSVGVTLLTKLSAMAARALGHQWETEIVEIHHGRKRDAPSGTALRLGQAIADATERSFSQTRVTDRAVREGPRNAHEIGFSSVRGGDSIGEHTVMLFGRHERIELTHRTSDRSVFAAGALRAARWVGDQSPGLYDMADVLGL